jgi:hypothetical protein
MTRVLHMILDFIKTVITFPVRLVQTIIEVVAAVPPSQASVASEPQTAQVLGHVGIRNSPWVGGWVGGLSPAREEPAGAAAGVVTGGVVPWRG